MAAAEPSAADLIISRRVGRVRASGREWVIVSSKGSNRRRRDYWFCSVAKTYSCCRQRASHPMVFRVGRVLLHIKVQNRLAVRRGASASESIAKNRVRIVGIGKQSIIGSE